MKSALNYISMFMYTFFTFDVVCIGKGIIRKSDEWLKKTATLHPAHEGGKWTRQFLTQYNSQTLKMNEQKGDAYALW
jgi:hypothetical protein